MRVYLATFMLAGFALSAIAAPGDAALEDDQAPEFPRHNKDAWALELDYDAETATHDLSGFVCPFSLSDGYSLRSTAQYSVGGEDVSCLYANEGERAYMTYYLSWYGTTASSKDQAESSIDSIKTVKTLGDELANRPEQIYLGDTAVDCHYIEYVQISTVEDEKTAVRSCTINGWVYKTRITWANSERYVDADTTFQAQQTKLGNMFNMCEGVALPVKDALLADPSNTVTLALLMSLVSDEVSGQSNDDAAASKNPPTLTTADTANTTECVLDVPATSTRAYLLTAAAQGGQTKRLAYTVSSTEGRASEPFLWISGLSLGDLTLEDTTYAAWMRVDNGAGHVIKTYQSIPTQIQMRTLLNQVIRGDIQSLGSYTLDADGNSTVNLTSDILDDTPGEHAED